MIVVYYSIFHVGGSNEYLECMRLNTNAVRVYNIIIIIRIVVRLLYETTASNRAVSVVCADCLAASC